MSMFRISGIDPGPSVAFDDQCGTRRSFRAFLTLAKSAVLTSLRPPPIEIGAHEAVFFPMHRTKYAQMAPLEEALPSPPLFLLAPWPIERMQSFNEFVLGSGRKHATLEIAFPFRFWVDLALNLPYFTVQALFSPRLAARRLVQFFQLYGLAYGICRIVAAAQARLLVTAYEDSWYSSAVSQMAKRMGFRTLNLMHGNPYHHDQFFDLSLVFGEHHKRFLETNTTSRTRFIVSGSATIKETGKPVRFDHAAQLIWFDQVTCEILPGAVKAKAMGMLSDLLARLPAVSLAVKPHPAGSDEQLRSFLERHPDLDVLSGNSAKSVSEILEGRGIALTAFSTTGLEAIANGTASVFLNPGGELGTGPLEFMGEYAARDADELAVLISRLTVDSGFYTEFLLRQKRTLGFYYALGPFDYRGCLRELGVLSQTDLSPTGGSIFYNLRRKEE
jgi:hypothetical protein